MQGHHIANFFLLHVKVCRFLCFIFLPLKRNVQLGDNAEEASYYLLIFMPGGFVCVSKNVLL